MNITADHVRAARRHLAQHSFPDFACLVDIPTVPIGDESEADSFSTLKLGKLAAHHLLLCEKLQELEAGKIKNLMVFMPPGSAKSTYVDVVFIPWFMARKPRRHVILASYASEIAEKQGRRARQLVGSKSYANLLDRRLREDNRAAHQWTLDNGSEFMSGGLLSGLTGNRGALGVLDDPVKGRAEADSQTIRDKTWDAYINDFCSRLIPGAPQVMILTRWHEDDVAGRILPEGWKGESGEFQGRDGRQWHVICLPALADRADDPLKRRIGDTLWPEWFTEDHWRPFQRDPRVWSSLYQQKPTPSEGSYFKLEWLQHWDRRPAPVNVYGTSDYAVTEGGGDYTVHSVWGVDSTGALYRLANWRQQTDSSVWIDAMLDMVQKYKPLCWFGEGGVIQKAIQPALTRRMRERNIYCRVEWLSSIHDKPTRARGFQARAAQGQVYFEPGAELTEFLHFPAGVNDDQVDAASIMGRALDEAHPAVIPPKAVDKYVDRWDWKFNHDAEDGAESWKTV